MADRIKDENDPPICSAHIDLDVENPYGRFWSVISSLVWWAPLLRSAHHQLRPGRIRPPLEGHDLLPRSALDAARGERLFTVVRRSSTATVGPARVFFPLVVAYFPLSLLAGVIALRRPRLAVKAAAATPVAFAAGATALRRERAGIVADAWIGPNWLAAMCAGLWHGLWLALRARFVRREN